MPKRSHIMALLFALGALHPAFSFDLQNRYGDAGPAEEHVGVTMKVVGEKSRTGRAASTVFVHAPGRTFEVEIRNGLPEGVHVSILRFSTDGGLEHLFPSNLDSEPSELIPSGLTRRESVLVEAPMGPDLLILAWSAEPFDSDFLSLTESAPRRRPRTRSERRMDPSDASGDVRGGRTDAERAELGAGGAERSVRTTISEAFRDVHLPPKPPLDGAIRRNIRPQVVASTSLRFYYHLTTEASLVEPERERYALGE
ncbi:MAG TPA: hypothetical protein VMO47_15755, partial [Rhodothermales bacterium]|nr:hypothetical protein [Rhodothermales bacterium]